MQKETKSTQVSVTTLGLLGTAFVVLRLTNQLIGRGCVSRCHFGDLLPSFLSLL